jgi:hypothetical protein
MAPLMSPHVTYFYPARDVQDVAVEVDEAVGVIVSKVSMPLSKLCRFYRRLCTTRTTVD